jgi:cell wall-associated NlpC family hydrolase
MRIISFTLLVLMSITPSFGDDTEAAARKRLLEVAFKYRGVPYVYGAESPRAFDCSGFVRYVYREAYGIELPRSARGFYSVGTPIDARTAKAGDVYIYDTAGGAPSHVAILVGDGTVIHAVSDGPRTGVIVSPLADRYWSPRLIAVRTFIAGVPGKQSQSEAAASAPAAAKPSPAAVPMATKPPVSTAPAPAAPAEKPAAAQVTKAFEEAIVDIGFTIPAVKESFTDKIPTAAGTSVAFTLTNGTGKDALFIVLFFRVDPRTYKLQQIHEEKVKLAAKSAFGLPPYRFELPGKYKLVVKDSWGNQLFERSFVVTEALSAP